MITLLAVGVDRIAEDAGDQEVEVREADDMEEEVLMGGAEV